MTTHRKVDTRHARRLRVAALAGAGLVASCATATPTQELRMEDAGTASADRLCVRMADDFEMDVTEGTLLTGRTFSRRFLDTFLSAGGVSFSFNVTDADPAENCVNTERGVTCDLTGPAQILLRTPLGVAQYQVVEGDSALVMSEGATLLCKEPAASFGSPITESGPSTDPLDID